MSAVDPTGSAPVPVQAATPVVAGGGRPVGRPGSQNPVGLMFSAPHN